MLFKAIILAAAVSGGSASATNCSEFKSDLKEFLNNSSRKVRCTDQITSEHIYHRQFSSCTDELPLLKLVKYELSLRPSSAPGQRLAALLPPKSTYCYKQMIGGGSYNWALEEWYFHENFTVIVSRSGSD